MDACWVGGGADGKLVDFDTFGRTVWAASRREAAMLPTEVGAVARGLVGGIVVEAIVWIVEERFSCVGYKRDSWTYHCY